MLHILLGISEILSSIIYLSVKVKLEEEK